MLQSARVAADGRGKLLTSAELINAAIFIPKRASYWWPFCCLHAQCTGREQCFGVERLSWSLFSNAEPLPAECLQCLCNFPSLTWESIPYKMLSMCYKKQSMLYIAFLLVFDVSINIPPSQYFYLKPWQSHGDLLRTGWTLPFCMHAGVKELSILQALVWTPRWGKEGLSHWAHCCFLLTNIFHTRALVKDHGLLCAFWLFYIISGPAGKIPSGAQRYLGKVLGTLSGFCFYPEVLF